MQAVVIRKRQAQMISVSLKARRDPMQQRKSLPLPSLQSENPLIICITQIQGLGGFPPHCGTSRFPALQHLASDATAQDRDSSVST